MRMKLRRPYEKPTLMVVEVEDQVELLAGSAEEIGTAEDRNDYEDGGDPFSEY